MKCKKLYAAAVLLIAGIGGMTAQELSGFGDAAGFDSGFGDAAGFDSGFGDSSFGGFDAGTDMSGGSGASALSFNGTATFDVRGILGGDAYKDYGKPDDIKDRVTATPAFDLTVQYTGASTEISAVLTASESAIKDYPADIINELTFRAYLGDFVLEGGKMKVVWGKGDKLHVLDNFNANDYTDFIIPDYIDTRLAEPMLRGVWNAPSGMRAEIVWTPVMTADRLDASGMWKPASMTQVASTVTTEAFRQVVAAGAADMYTLYLSRSTSLVNDLYPDTQTFDFGQFGARMTGTIGIVDLGMSYYLGHYKTPSNDASKMESYITKYLAGSATEADKFLHYDRLQVFGFEGAAVVGMFNLRGEFAYNLTEDTAGDDPFVHNNSIAWIAGFDIDLPVHNVNVNIQNSGKYILKNDKIGTGKWALLKGLDVDYDSDGSYSNNKLVVQISDSFLHEKLKPEVRFLWGIERGDFLVMPKITYTVKDGFDLILSGLYITGLDGFVDSPAEFKAYQDNSFVQIGMKYSF